MQHLSAAYGLILDSTPPTEKIQITYADPAMWASNSVHEVVTTTAQEYLNNGLALTKADNSRLGGKRKIDELLACLPDGKPGVLVVECCENLIRVMPLMIHDEKNPEDIDTTLEDHPVDTFKYGLTNIQMKPEQKQIRQRSSPLGEVF
jgi:phage terminase large subunit